MRVLKTECYWYIWEISSYPVLEIFKAFEIKSYLHMPPAYVSVPKGVSKSLTVLGPKKNYNLKIETK